MKLGELIQGIGLAAPVDPAWRGVRICDITEDSRTVLPGSLFIARPGLKEDGRRFVSDAVGAGASAVLTGDQGVDRAGGLPVVRAADLPAAIAEVGERFFGRPSSRLAIAGVTGTNGKTTVSYMIYRLLNLCGMRCGLIGTVTIDDGREVARASMTTPPAIELSRTLATMFESRCVAAAIEVSSHALDQRRADGLDLGVGIFTNLTGDHLDYHKTLDAYGDAKARLFERLGRNARAVVNADDPAWERMVRGCSAKVLRCARQDGRGARNGMGADAECGWWAGDTTIDGTRARLAGPWGEFEVRIRGIGDHNIINALQALASAHAMGADAASLQRALPLVGLPPGRLERIAPADAGGPRGSGGGAGPEVFVDYAHSDDSLARALASLRPLAGARGGRLVAVFGCGGDRDRTKRPRMGAAARAGADAVVVTSDNPRTETPSRIIDEILMGIPHAERGGVEVQADRAQAIAHAIETAHDHDIILIAGKGHEDYQILPDGRGGTRSIHFDDKDHAARALHARAVAAHQPAAGASP